MKTDLIVSKFSELVKIDKENFLDMIKKQNKAKHWTISPVRIELKDSQIVENSEEIKKYVSLMQEWAENELNSSDININVLDDDMDLVRTIYVWFNGSRKQVTSGFDIVKRNFTSLENEIKQIGIQLKAKKEALLEAEYQKNEDVLRSKIAEKLARVKNENDVEIDASLFEDFIASRRKNKILTSKNELVKRINDEVENLIKKILDPILKEREAQRLKEQDLQKLALDLQDINLNILTIQEGENVLKILNSFKDTINIRYPNAIQEARMQINAGIRIVEATINRLEAEIKAEKQRLEAEKQRAEKEALQKAEADRITEEKAKQEEIKAKAKSIQEAQRPAETLKAPPTSKIKKSVYKLPLEELQVLAEMEFEADNEDEAKTQIVEMFIQQLEFANLIEMIK